MMQFSNSCEPAFTRTGFCNWKDATRCFNRHEHSASHAEAVMKWGSYCAGLNVANQLNSKRVDEQKLATRMLLKILSSIRYLARQGIAIRGHSADEGNLQALIHLQSDDSNEFRHWISRRVSFVSHDIQNEYLQLMAHHVLRSLLDRIRQAQYFSLVADEVTDQARQHQLGISVRWVDDDFFIHEDFIELCEMPEGDAETITAIIKDCLCRMSLPVTACRGQCYDGASVMSGKVAGVSQRISSLEPRAVYVHCLAHSLNLALQDSARALPLYRDMLEYVKDIVNLIRMSPKRSALLNRVRENATDNRSVGRSLRPLCPTRWTCRHEAIRSIIDSYKELLLTLEEIASTDKSDAGTKARGLQSQMQSFSFFFSVQTGLLIFERTELLSKVLQAKDMTVTGAVKAADQASHNIQQLREDGAWSSLWSSCVTQAAQLDVDEPTLPRMRHPPRRFDSASSPCVLTAEQHHRMLFFQLVDNILTSIKSRLLQPNMQFYSDSEDVILTAANTKVMLMMPTERQQYENSIQSVCEHFGSDLDVRRITLQLDMLCDLVNGKPVKNMQDVVEIIKTLGPVRRLYGELSKLLRLLMVIPATSATAERSFSCLRRVQNYLRSTMSQERLNHLLILHAHRDVTDTLDLNAVARDFVSLNDFRRNLFGYARDLSKPKNN